MRLSEVLQDARSGAVTPSLDLPGDFQDGVGNLDIKGIAISSDKVQPGFIFAALPGHHTHGAHYVPDAVDRGAVAVITDERGKRIIGKQGEVGVPVMEVGDPRRLAATIAAAVAGFPAHSLTMVGVTGTNGKTSVSYLVSMALQAHGIACGVLGTLGARIGDRSLDSGPRTTPEATDIHPILKSMHDDGARAVVMEVSSIALCENRVDGITFDLAVFTGLSHDHLDYHEDMETYFAAKSELFTPERARQAVVLVDDEWGARLASAATIPVVTVSTRGRDADWQVLAARDGLRLLGADGEFNLDIPVAADFVLANIAVSVVSAHILGSALEAAIGAVLRARVPGRMELVARAGGIDFIVDYAHSPDAIDQVVAAARSERHARGGGRVIVVIGAGGDRDRLKRLEMGLAASRADVAIVTDDNPRSEDPAEIRSQVLSGFDSGANVHEVASRHEAIGRAVSEAREGDVVLVLGKGHETTQEGPHGVIAFDDRVVLASFVDSRFNGESGEGVT